MSSGREPLLFSQFLKTRNLEYLISLCSDFEINFKDVLILPNTSPEAFLDEVLTEFFFAKLLSLSKEKVANCTKLLTQNGEIAKKLLNYLEQGKRAFAPFPNRTRLILNNIQSDATPSLECKSDENILASAPTNNLPAADSNSTQEAMTQQTQPINRFNKVQEYKRFFYHKNNANQYQDDRSKATELTLEAMARSEALARQFYS